MLRYIFQAAILQKMHSRKMLVTKLDGWRDEQDTGQNGDEEGSVVENIQQELEVNDDDDRESELSHTAETLSTMFSPSPAVDSSEVERDLETSVEEDQVVLKTDAAQGATTADGPGGESKVQKSSILTVDQRKESGNESDEPSSPGSENELVAAKGTGVEQFPRNSWSIEDGCVKENFDKNSLFFSDEANNCTSPRGKHVRARRASCEIMYTTEPVLDKSKTGFSRCRTSLTGFREPNKDHNISTRRGSSPNLIFTATQEETTREKSSLAKDELGEGNPPRRRMLARRASSPSLMFTAAPKYTTAEEPRLPKHEPGHTSPPRRRMLARRASSPDLMFTVAPKDTTAEKPRLTSINELALGNISTEIPTAPRQRLARRSSIAVMTGVANPLAPGFPSPQSLVRCPPELRETSQRSTGPGSEKSSLDRRGSVQETHMHDSLRKISRRLNAPLTGAQLEKRLQAHRVDASGLQSKVACTPEKKAPSELDINDLGECRYIRKRVSKSN
jgi:hypothetical protein